MRRGRMLQRNSDFFFSRPMIYFGPFHHINEEDGDVDEGCEMMQPFIVEIDPKHPLSQDIGLYFLWPDS